MKSSIRNTTSKYKVSVHPDVDALIAGMTEPQKQDEVRNFINDLTSYPLVLGHWDIEKIHGRPNTYRTRIGRYRFLFVVDKASRSASEVMIQEPSRRVILKVDAGQLTSRLKNEPPS